MVLGSLLDDIEIVVVHRLRVVVVATWDDITHIARLHSVVAILVHQLEGLFDMTLVVLCRRRGLVVHHQLHTLGVGIVVEHLQVEVGIWGHEVEDITLPMVGPVLPTHVPAFHQHLVKSVLGGKVDVALHLLIVGGMTSVRLYLRPVYLVELDAGELVGIVPRTLTDNHFPPYATVLRRMNP